MSGTLPNKRSDLIKIKKPAPAAKRGKTVYFDENIQEVNVMENYDDPIPRKTKEKKLAIKKLSIESAKADAA